MSTHWKDAIQRDLNRFEKWASVKLRKFDKANYKVLHLHLDNPQHKYRLRREWIENSAGGKNLEVLVNEKFNMP